MKLLGDAPHPRLIFLPEDFAKLIAKCSADSCFDVLHMLACAHLPNCQTAKIARFCELNLYGMVDAQIAAVEKELFSD